MTLSDIKTERLVVVTNGEVEVDLRGKSRTTHTYIRWLCQGSLKFRPLYVAGNAPQDLKLDTSHRRGGG